MSHKLKALARIVINHILLPVWYLGIYYIFTGVVVGVLIVVWFIIQGVFELGALRPTEVYNIAEKLCQAVEIRSVTGNDNKYRRFAGPEYIWINNRRCLNPFVYLNFWDNKPPQPGCPVYWNWPDPPGSEYYP